MKRREFVIRTSRAPLVAMAGVLGRRATKRPAAETTHHPASQPATGPLHPHPDNPRYFSDGSGQAIYLSGSHTWLNLQDIVGGERSSRWRCPPAFDYEQFLEFLQRYNHNFFRLWTWESSWWVLRDSTVVRLAPLPFVRTGPGTGVDGGRKFDLTRFNPEYFDRLRRRVAAAGDRGIYVAVMLFQGFSVARKEKRRKATPWRGHPFHKANNVNGIDGDRNNDGEGYEVHTLTNSAITKIQEAYVRKVIDTVGDLDNVLYEISNESHGGSTRWQYHLVDLIHRYEKSKSKQHPVWMSYQWDGIAGAGTNEDLFTGPAECVSPSPNVADHDWRYRSDPPAANGAKIIIADTDHLWGIGGNPAWVWKCFLRGMHPIFMDPYRNSPHRWNGELDPKWDPVRRAMGRTRRFAETMNLARMTPRNDLASTAYCLAHPGEEYLVYLPAGGAVSVDLSGAQGKLAVEWFDPDRDVIRTAGPVRGGERRTLTAPFSGHTLLHLTASHSGPSP